MSNVSHGNPAAAVQTQPLSHQSPMATQPQNECAESPMATKSQAAYAQSPMATQPQGMYPPGAVMAQPQMYQPQVMASAFNQYPTAGELRLFTVLSKIIKVWG